jgi:hypothetical protein
MNFFGKDMNFMDFFLRANLRLCYLRKLFIVTRDRAISDLKSLYKKIEEKSWQNQQMDWLFLAIKN